MKPFIKPRCLETGSTVAAISISGGRAGDPDLRWRYELGKKRLETVFGLRVIETPNALRGTAFLYQNPRARAEDLLWALENSEVEGIITCMGGDDSYRILPFLDRETIRRHPKVMMGFSDITTTCMVFARAGVTSFYGPCLLTPIAQPGELDPYTENAVRKTLFSSEAPGLILPCEAYTPIDWQDKAASEIIWQKNSGYRCIQGQGKVRGRLLGGCVGPLQQIMGTDTYPSAEMWDGALLFLENGIPYGSLRAELHAWRAIAASGAFSKAAGLITPEMTEEVEQILLKVLKEAGREDLPVLVNADFGHRTPMTVLPLGAIAEIDCGQLTFSILESAVC